MMGSRERDREEVVARLQGMREELDKTKEHFEIGLGQLQKIDAKLAYLMSCLGRQRETTAREQVIIEQAREDAK